jgi:hypothetical protein
MGIGETVRIAEGPFQGMYGRIVSTIRRRVVLTVVFGSREFHVEMDRDWTIAAAAPHRQPISHIERSNLSQRLAGS